MGLYKFVRSKGYKNFMTKLYGWGASLVILGALFKIQHYPGAGVMLMLGMCTEAIIFFFSAFEPLHVEYNWALVYPELALGEDEEVEKEGKKADKKKALTGTPTQQLDQMLTEAKIGPELIESLASGMRNLSENAHKLAGAADATAATDGYVNNLQKAAESVRNLTLQYDKTSKSLDTDSNISAAYLQNVQKAASAVGNLASIYEETTKALKSDTGSYNEQLNKLNQNLTSINTIYESQMKNTEAMAKANRSVLDSMNNFADTLNASLSNVEVYKKEVDQLTKNVSRLNDVYGKMVAAMQH
ncbi:MAG: gliding motility protein GldL [Bacteroidales bacterium]|jgi:gliding motility-associated protein GldL|nr:gliding motility protein GldL [Bacteroidales bacterium]